MKRKPYERPIIQRLQTGLMNKMGIFSNFYTKKVRSHIDGVPIKSLIQNFGSPLFVFSEKRLRKKIREFRQVFENQYPNVEFSWSYKTNYLSAICSILHQEGETAEVVSEFEYEKARHLGVPGEKIIFNGPYKPYHILKRAVQEGARINIDSFEEIIDLENIAQELGRKIKIGIRLNMDTGIYPQWNRFGFNLENGQALDAVKRIAMGKLLEINGLHCHQGTFILEPNSYAIQVEKMVNFAYKLEEEFNYSIEYIDIGGGFPSKNRLKGLYLPPETIIPSISEFAEKIGHALLNSLKPGDYPKLILECGRAIVDEAGFLVTTIISSKRLPDGRRAYVIDAGVNLLYTAYWYHFRTEIDKNVYGTPEPCVLYGPLCMNIDVIDDFVHLPPLSKGDHLILWPVGAYNVSQWMQFITYRPAVVIITENGKPEIIRERETLNDIIAKEYLPDKFKLK